MQTALLICSAIGDKSYLLLTAFGSRRLRTTGLHSRSTSPIPTPRVNFGTEVLFLKTTMGMEVV